MYLGAGVLRVVCAGDGHDGVDGPGGGVQHVGQGAPVDASCRGPAVRPRALTLSAFLYFPRGLL
jgi:hypothetical protein